MVSTVKRRLPGAGWSAALATGQARIEALACGMDRLAALAWAWPVWSRLPGAGSSGSACPRWCRGMMHIYLLRSGGDSWRCLSFIMHVS